MAMADCPPRYGGGGLSAGDGGLRLESRINNFVGFQSRDEDVEDPEEDKDASGHGLDGLKKRKVIVSILFNRKKSLLYSEFHKTLPKSILQMLWISVRFFFL